MTTQISVIRALDRLDQPSLRRRPCGKRGRTRPALTVSNFSSRPATCGHDPHTSTPRRRFIRLDGTAIPTFVTAGHEAEGRAVAQRTDRVLHWLDAIFGTRPSTTLYVAGPEDWDRVAAIPLYGMPTPSPTGSPPARPPLRSGGTTPT